MHCLAFRYRLTNTLYSVRGFFVGSLQLLLGVGALIGSGVTKAYSGSHTKEGWLVPMSIQIIPAAIALAFVAFTPGQYFLPP